MVEALAAVALIVTVIAGALLRLRRVTHRGVAITSRAVDRARQDVIVQAPERGWSVLPESLLPARLPEDLAMRFAPAEVCEFAVVSTGRAAFEASTWVVRVRNAGSAVSLVVRQHYLVIPLEGETPRFAIGRPHDLKSTTRNLPDDLVPLDRRKIGACWMHGDDRGWAQVLEPLVPELAEGHIWLIAAGDRLVLTRQGELDADGLAQRVMVGTRAAALLQSLIDARP